MNIAALIKEQARLNPSGQAVVFPAGRDAQGHALYSHYTYARFDYESDALALALRTLGVQAGMRTLMFVRPGLAFPLITFALFKLGAIPVLIDPGMGRKNLRRAMAEVQPEALIAVPEVHWLRPFLRGALARVKIAITTGAHPWWATSLRTLLPHARDYAPLDLALHPAHADDCAAILFTSGGTGKPKGVVYSHGNFARQVALIKDLYGLTPADRDLAGFPLFALLTMAMGVTSVIPPMDPSKPAQADPAALVQTMLDQGVTTANGSPAIWERVGRYCQERGLVLPQIKALMMYGAPVATALHTLFAPLLPNGTTYSPYGATECLPVASLSGREVLADTAAATRAGQGTCVGWPAAGTRIQIVAPVPTSAATALQPLPIGAVGEIIVAGAQATGSYFANAAATALAKIPDPQSGFWHRMGDLGYLDAHGRLWFCGRVAHAVATPAGPRYSIPCEAIFNAHPAVKRTALIGLPDTPQASGDGGDGGDGGGVLRPCLVVERRDGRSRLAGADASVFKAELLALGQAHPHTQQITRFFLAPHFPVDPRHNIKIDRLHLQRSIRADGGNPL